MIGRGLVAGVMLAVAMGGAQAQELKTAVDGTFAPHAFPDLASGGVQGFNVDLAKAIGEKLKRPVKIDSAQFSGLVPAMQAGTYDFLAAPVTVTKERAESMLFTEGYLNTDFQMVTARNTPDITKLEDLKGKVVTVNKGSAYDSWARGLEAQIGWTVESFGTQTDAVQAVIAGRAVANITGNTVAAWVREAEPRSEALLPAFDRPRLVHADPQGQRGDASDAGECDRMPQARRNGREIAREMVRHEAGARIGRRHGLSRHGRAWHAGSRCEAADPELRMSPAGMRLAAPWSVSRRP